MKKTFILLTAVIATIFSTVNSATAQNFNFAKDEEGEIFMSGTVSYDCSAKTAMNRLTTYLETIFDQDQITVDEESGIINLSNASMNSKYTYNPFAGEFKDEIIFNLTITPDEESQEFQYIFTRLSLRSTAKGFANYDRRDPLRVVLKKYAKAKKIVDDRTLDKRGKQTAINEMDDLSKSLTKASETLLALMEKLQENVE